MSHKGTLATLVVALLLVTAGCSTASNSGVPQAGGDGGGEATAGGDGSNAATDAAGAGTAGEGGEGTPAAGDRKLVRTARLTMEVESFQSTRSNLTASVRRSGGYVGDASMETEEYENETYTQGTLVLRVPVENYSSFLAAVEGEGTVLRMDENVDDVTREYVDLEARLENLRAQRDRLRGLYERANDTEEVLAVEERLSEVQGEIERTEARLRTLRNRVALATITVSIREERPPREPPERTQWYDVGLVDAFLDSVSGVVTTLRAAAVALAYVLPYLLVFGLPLVGLAVLLRRVGRPDPASLRNRGGGE